MIIASIADTATDYTIQIRSQGVSPADATIEYEMQVFRPAGSYPSNESGLLDAVISVPLRTDGTGHPPLHTT